MHCSPAPVRAPPEPGCQGRTRLQYDRLRYVMTGLAQCRSNALVGDQVQGSRHVRTASIRTKQIFSVTIQSAFILYRHLHGAEVQVTTGYFSRFQTLGSVNQPLGVLSLPSPFLASQSPAIPVPPSHSVPLSSTPLDVGPL